MQQSICFPWPLNKPNEYSLFIQKGLCESIGNISASGVELQITAHLVAKARMMTIFGSSPEPLVAPFKSPSVSDTPPLKKIKSENVSF
jgi:hypothetical protein